MLSISSMALSQFLKMTFRDKVFARPWRQLRAGQWMTAAVGAMVGLLLHWPAQAQDLTRRIVVAGGDLTEIVFALDAEDHLVGVDQTSTWPPQAQDLPQIGYVRRLSAEGILSLDPDLLIAAHDAGPGLALQQLRRAGILVVQAPDMDGTDGVMAKITLVGEILNREDDAQALAAQFQADLAAVQAKVATLTRKPRVLFILSIAGNAPIVGGRDTAADDIVRLAGATNAAAAVSGYKPMGREAILAARPDVLLLMDHHADTFGGAKAILSRPELALTPAGQAGRVVTMDGLLLLGFGPRTPQAVAQLVRALQPRAAVEAGL